MGEMYCLQSRWRLEENSLIYYGLRNKDKLFKNKTKLSKKQREIIAQLPSELDKKQIKRLSKLIGCQIVKQSQIKTIPRSIREATFCTACCANDFMIPGIEFDENGQCPICQTSKQTSQLKSIVPIVKDIPKSEKSRFDVAVFYTGGKDSTYLLYYLAKVKKLRVLALTWDIPFMSESAKKSIEGAKKAFQSVEFIVRTVSEDTLRKIYLKLFELSGNTCACPSLAYVLFYPELVINRVPYFIAGNEPAQILGLYYNNMAPKIAYSFWGNKFYQTVINIGRVLTLHPPLKAGQFHTLVTMKQLAKGDSVFKKMSGYKNVFLSNIVTAIHQDPLITKPLRRVIRSSSWSGNIPAFVQIDFDEISGGKYEWKKIKHILTEECGWHEPDEEGKGLHTSCQIEKCKEYTQFKRFYNCESQMIPFSALEMAIATGKQNLSKEEAIAEIENCLGFSLDEIPEYRCMCDFLEKKR